MFRRNGCAKLEALRCLLDGGLGLHDKHLKTWFEVWLSEFFLQGDSSNRRAAWIKCSLPTVEAGLTASEHRLSRNHGIQRVPTEDLKWERDELSKSEGTNPSGCFGSRKIMLLTFWKQSNLKFYSPLKIDLISVR